MCGLFWETLTLNSSLFSHSSPSLHSLSSLLSFLSPETHPHAKLPPELALPSDRHLDRRRSRSTPTSALFKAGQLLLGVGRRKRRFGRQKGAVVPPVGTAVYGGDGVLSLVSFDPLLPLVMFRLGLKQVFKVLRPVFADLASKILVTVRAVSGRFRPFLAKVSGMKVVPLASSFNFAVGSFLKFRNLGWRVGPTRRRLWWRVVARPAELQP